MSSRRTPLRKDRGVTLHGPTAAKPNSWRVIVADAGRRREYTARSRREADAIFDQEVTKARQQLSTEVRLSSTPTMDDLAKRMLTWAENARKSPRYVELLGWYYQQHVSPQVGSLPVADWTATQSIAILSHAADSGLGRSSLSSIVSVLTNMRNEGQRRPRWIGLDDNPLEGVQLRTIMANYDETVTYKDPSSRPTTADVEGLADWLRERYRTNPAVARSGRWWLHIPVLLAAYSGMRLGEVFALRPIDILSMEENDRRIRVTGNVLYSAFDQSIENSRSPFPKNRRHRTVIFPPFLLEPLQRRVEEVTRTAGREAPLFPATDGGWIGAHTWNSLITKFARAAGVWPKNIPLENLRHHAATWMYYDCGIPLETVSILLGHHSPAFTMERYFRAPSAAIPDAQVLMAQATSGVPRSPSAADDSDEAA